MSEDEQTTPVAIYTAASRDVSFFQTLVQVVYSFPSQVQVGFWMGTRAISAEIRTNRLGLVWLALSPLIYVLAFIILRSNFKEGLPASLSVLSLICGLVIFQAWLDSFMNQLSTFSSNKTFLKNIGICTDSLFYAAIIKSIILNFPKIVFVLIYALVVNEADFGSLIMYLIAYLMAALNGSAFGYLLAPFASFMNDIKIMIQSSSLFLMAASSSFVNLSSLDWRGFDYLVLNPAAVFVESSRQFLTGQVSILTDWYFYWISISFAGALAALTINRITRRIIAERL